MSAGRHTPGPWRWEFNEKHRQLTLVGGRPKYDLTIMEFCRWGMWGAGVSMRDTAPEAEGFNLMHKVHERSDWVVPLPGRAHHKDWCAAVAHPDMLLMQAAPDLLQALDDLLRDAKDPMDKATTEYFRKQAFTAIAKATGTAE